MNTSKLLLGTLIGTVVVFLLDALFYGSLTRDVFTMVPGYDREWPQWPWLIFGLVIFMGAFTYAYMAGEDSKKPRVPQGARYGLVIGIMFGFGMGFVLYSIQDPKPWSDYVIDGVYTVVKLVVAGALVAYFSGKGSEGAGGDVSTPTAPGDEPTPVEGGG